MKHIVTMSGGKDSTATLLHLLYDLKLENVEAVFCDTGHEAQLTYWYVVYLAHTVLPIKRITAVMQQLRKDLDPNEPMDMLKLCKHKKRFPGNMTRFCTTELKMKPIRTYLKKRMEEEPDETFVLVNGIRAEESPPRS
jgi:3'-phosphoadenosine 5'-phosphosulfate sulfotransferase (PAPS reductase)/FAD synthetase